MSDKIPVEFVDLPDIHNIKETCPDWYYRAFVAWNYIPAKIPVSGLAWLLGVKDDALEALPKRFGWKSRREMRRESKECDAKQKQSKALSIPTPKKIGNEIVFDGPLEKVSLIKLIKWVELKAKEAALEEDSGKMNSWLLSLAGIDSAIRARKSRQIEKIKKDSVKIYLPKQDEIPAMDIEDAKIIPPPVEF